MKKLVYLLLVILLLYTYTYYIEPSRLVTTHKSINVINANNALCGLRIGVIGDLHIGSRNVNILKLHKIIQKINAENVDIIVLVGDFDAKLISSSKIPQELISKELSQLKSKYGVFAVPGNHDYFPQGVVKNILKQTNIILLEDADYTIQINDAKFRLVGIHDIWHYNFNKQIVNKSSELPTILLSHNPDVFAELPDNVILVISGHTHGGEINIPIFGAPFVPSNYGQKFKKGIVYSSKSSLFITSGIASLSRFRSFNPPEIAILTLKPVTKLKQSREKHKFNCYRSQ